MKPAFYIIIAIAVLALLALGVFIYNKNKKAKAAQLQIDVVNAGNAAVTAYQEGVENQYFANGGNFR